MPLKFYHGPPGALKSNYLIQNEIGPLLKVGPQSAFFTVLPSRELIPWYEQKILDLVNLEGVSLRNTLGTFDDLLRIILTVYRPEARLIPALLSRQLLRKLFHQNGYPQLRKYAAYPTVINELLASFVSLKQNLFTPERLIKKCQPYLTPLLSDYLKLFCDYQNALHHCGELDPGDAYLIAHQQLIEKNWRLPDHFQALFLDRVFPLTLGQQELLRCMVGTFPDWHVSLAYSFSYQATEDSFFYPAYSRLGETATETEYFHHTNTEQLCYRIVFNQATQEFQWTAQTIFQLHKHGIPLHRIGVIVPNPRYHAELYRALAALGITNATEITEQVAAYASRLLTGPLFRRQSERTIGRSCSTTSPQGVVQSTDLLVETMPFLPFTSEMELAPMGRALRAIKTLQDFEALWDYGRTTYLQSIRDEAMIRDWKQAELDHTPITMPHRYPNLWIGSATEAGIRDWDVLFIMGFTNRDYPHIKHHSPIFADVLGNDPELREVFKSPAYQWATQSQHLYQAINRTQRTCYATRSLIGQSGTETYSSRLLETFPLSWQDLHPEAPREPSTIPLNSRNFSSTRNQGFAALRKKQFSLSELQTYQTCPYRYYAQHQLKLGETEPEEMELSGSVRGQFVHLILEKLIGGHRSLLRDAIEYDLYKGRLHEAIIELVHLHQNLHQGLNQSHHLLKKEFSERLIRVLCEYFDREITLWRSKKKLTFPEHLEWAFGRGSTPPLKIKMKGQTVLLSGRVDRIDTDPQNKTYHVIDYKTGQLDSIKALKEGKSLQLPIYLLAVQTLLYPDWKPGGGSLVSFKDLDKTVGLFIKENSVDEPYSRGMSLTLEAWEETLQLTQAEIERIVTGIQSGNFAPNPADDNFCQYCDYRRVCHKEDVLGTNH